jgi:hypothetical protein
MQRSTELDAVRNASDAAGVVARATPKGHEQVQIDFIAKRPAAKLDPLFEDYRDRAASI